MIDTKENGLRNFLLNYYNPLMLIPGIGGTTNYSLSQTPDVHLKPEPKATCMIRWPFFKGFVCWCS